MANEPATFRNLITAFTDFLTVAIHAILYERCIYPQTSFLSARKYNFAVRQSRHPKVCEWINDAVTAVEAELLKCAVERVAVVIYTKANKPVERFMFDFSRFPVVPAGDIDTVLERIPASDGELAVLPTVDLEEQFRATMGKITNCNQKLKPLPAGCTFTVAIELKQSGLAPIGHPQPWVPVELGGHANKSKDEIDVRTIPLRAVAAGELVFETWVEQHRENETVD